jgi:hypothetical protein
MKITLSKQTRSLALAAGIGVSMFGGAWNAGCAGDRAPEVSESGPGLSWDEFRANPPMTWETFRASVSREPSAPYRFIVDGDIPLSDEQQLWDHYQAWLAQEYAHTTGSTSALTVRHVLGADVLWSAAQKFGLTYCISDSFGTNKPAVIAAMAAATQSWSDRVAVQFTYHPDQDAACTSTNTSVLFNVSPSSSPAFNAMAFFPDSVRAERQLLITSSGLTTNSGGRDLQGILRHETGHILGFRHEHIWINCTGESTAEARQVTSYDVNSVMHLPECRPSGTGGYRQTELDFSGAASLYGGTTGILTRDADEKADLNGDGMADICARGAAGVYCALSTGTSFGAVSLWTSGFSDADNWNVGSQYYATIRFPDLNNDDRADICGRGAAGVFCALSTGTSFGPVSLWETSFSDANQFNLGPEFYSTIRFPDLNNDGRADVCGRGRTGVFCELSTGTSFGPASLWTAAFSDADDWNHGPQYYSTIQFPDLNNDGRADICGRGGAGVFCALSTGTSFGPATLWETAFSDANQFNLGPEFYSTIRFPDVNNDDRADICGRGRDGVFCELSTGTSFGAASLWTAAFSDADNWSLGPQYYSTIRFPDLNNDGRADVCGRGGAGVFCALSTGTSFGAATLWETAFSDANQFNLGPEFYSTIRFPDLNNDGRADVCGRGRAGVFCELSTATSFGAASLWAAFFSDANGWNLGPQYYSTIRFP